MLLQEKPKNNGWFVLPFIDGRIAEALLVPVARLAESSPFKTLFLMIPEVNQNAMGFVEKFGSTMKLESVTMFSSDPSEAVVMDTPIKGNSVVRITTILHIWFIRCGYNVF